MRENEPGSLRDQYDQGVYEWMRRMFENIRTKRDIRSLRRSIKGAIRRGRAEMEGKPPHLREMISSVIGKLESELSVVEFTLRNYDSITVTALKLYLTGSETEIIEIMAQYETAKREWKMS